MSLEPGTVRAWYKGTCRKYLLVLIEGHISQVCTIPSFQAAATLNPRISLQKGAKAISFRLRNPSSGAPTALRSLSDSGHVEFAFTETSEPPPFPPAWQTAAHCMLSWDKPFCPQSKPGPRPARHCAGRSETPPPSPCRDLLSEVRGPSPPGGPVLTAVVLGGAQRFISVKTSPPAVESRIPPPSLKTVSRKTTPCISLTLLSSARALQRPRRPCYASSSRLLPEPGNILNFTSAICYVSDLPRPSQLRPFMSPTSSLSAPSSTFLEINTKRPIRAATKPPDKACCAPRDSTTVAKKRTLALGG